MNILLIQDFVIGHFQIQQIQQKKLVVRTHKLVVDKFKSLKMDKSSTIPGAQNWCPPVPNILDIDRFL